VLAIFSAKEVFPHQFLTSLSAIFSAKEVFPRQKLSVAGAGKASYRLKFSRFIFFRDTQLILPSALSIL